MADNTDRPIAAFYFDVNVAGEHISFQEVSGLEAEMELEEISEGGLNNYKHRLPKNIKYNNLVLKRALLAKSGSPFLEWCRSTLHEDSDFAKIVTKEIKISLLDEKKARVMHWNVVNAFPVKMQMSNFKSDDNSLAIETVEFAFQSFTIE